MRKKAIIEQERSREKLQAIGFEIFMLEFQSIQ